MNLLYSVVLAVGSIGAILAKRLAIKDKFSELATLLEDHLGKRKGGVEEPIKTPH